MVEAVTDDREQKVHRSPGEEAGEIVQMLGQELLVQVRHAEKDIELGAQAHPPQHHEGPDADLVGAVPGQPPRSRAPATAIASSW